MSLGPLDVDKESAWEPAHCKGNVKGVAFCDLYPHSDNCLPFASVPLQVSTSGSLGPLSVNPVHSTMPGTGKP